VTDHSVIIIEEDRNNQAAGYKRAFYADTPRSDVMVTVIGYSSPGGSFRSVSRVVSHIRQYDKTTPIYRDGRLIDAGSK